jgi:hypothetical protein
MHKYLFKGNKKAANQIKLKEYFQNLIILARYIMINLHF